MKVSIDELKKISQSDPKLFINVIDDLIGVIDLLLGIKEFPELEQKFKHSRDLFKAECLLDSDLEKKGKLAERMLSLIMQVAQFAITKA